LDTVGDAFTPVVALRGHSDGVDGHIGIAALHGPQQIGHRRNHAPCEFNSHAPRELVPEVDTETGQGIRLG
jgi:hypothetical protein